MSVTTQEPLTHQTPLVSKEQTKVYHYVYIPTYMFYHAKTLHYMVLSGVFKIVGNIHNRNQLKLDYVLQEFPSATL